MGKQKRWLALVMSLALVFSMFPSMASAADLGSWQFGAFGGNTSATKNTYASNPDGSVTLKAVNGGKIASTDEGLSFYYKQVPANANFEIRAKAKVVSFSNPGNTPSQASFGLMVRGNIGLGTTTTTSNFVAAGGFGVNADATTGAPATTVTQVVYRTGATVFTNHTSDTRGTQGKSSVFSGVNDPIEGEEYDISIKKIGNAYQQTINGKSITYSFDLYSHTVYAGKAFAGLYVARDAEIIFSNFDIVVDSRAPIDIELDTTSMKTQYLKDQPLDASGLKVTAVYAGNERVVLSASDYILTGFNSSQVGTNQITVNFNGISKAINLNIQPLTVTNIGTKYLPAKTEYYPGDQFDPEGIAISATYDSGLNSILTSDKYGFSITGATVTGSTYTFDTPGLKTVTVHSNETPSETTSFNINVKNAPLTGLEISQSPQKVLYHIGDTFIPNGMIVYAKYSDNSRVSLLNSEYSAVLDTSTAGAKQVVVSYRGQQASTNVIVKQKELTAIQVTQYPQTTFTVGEDIVTTGLKVSKIYDNLDREEFASANYTIDTTAFNKNVAGTYSIRIVPTDVSISPIVYKVTVREQVQPEWKSIRFGQSTSNTANTITPNGGTVQLVALEGGGKVTGDHDGISFYYTELDAVQDNFALSADIKVTAYAKNPYDGQESFGIMARDAIGTSGDSSVFASNIAAVGGFSGRTTSPNGTQLFVRTGVENKDGKGSKGIQSKMLNNERPATSNTHPTKPYKLTLSKTNSGFTGKLNNGVEEIFFVPDILTVQDSKMYVGFYAARLATIEVSNIQLKVTAAETDEPKIEAPKQAVTPDIQFVSLEQTSKTDYVLSLQSNVSGSFTIKQGTSVLASELNVSAGQKINLPTTVTANTYTNFNASFVPDDKQLLTSYAKLVKNFTVTMKTFVPGGDIYVSPTGSSSGLGTSNDPLDLDTAIAFVSPGQKIIVQDGRYVRKSKLEMKKGNNGTASAMKSLLAAPGTRPVIDFVKKSEGVVLSGDYWHVKGIDFTRSAPNTKGFTVGGNHNTVESSRFYANGDTGLQISSTDGSTDFAQWPSYNLILNSESFDNMDPSNNNADGFAAKLTSGVGNVFRGDIAHHNIDDGWDLYTKAGSGATGAVIIEDSIAYSNGTLTNGKVGDGDKNGFKLGGEGIHVPHMIRNSLAFGNGANGFTSNSNPGVKSENNIAFDNAKGNLSFTTYAGIQTDFEINGFVSYQKTYSSRDSYPAELNADNNFMFNGSVSANKSGVTLSDINFVSLQPVVPYQRNTDGSIVRSSFLQFIAPPTVPVNLTASAGNTKVSLSWNTVTGATYYNIYRGLAEDSSFSQIANVTATNYTDTGLLNGTTYFYKVTSANTVGESVYSFVVNATPRSSGSSTPVVPPVSSGIVQPSDNGVTVSLEPVKETVDGKNIAKVTVDASTLGKAFDALEANEQMIQIEVKSTESVAKVQLDANGLLQGQKAAPDAVLSIKSNNVTYDLPVRTLNLDALAKALGTDASNVKINITIEKVSGTTGDQVNAEAKESGVSLLTGAVEFTITAEANGKTVGVNDFGGTYVSRTITLEGNVDSSQATAVLYNPETGSFTFVPATFTTVDGKTEVTIKRQGNSIYTVVEFAKTFADLKGHWAKADVELLASKLIIQGTSDTAFSPNSSITRAEFAALLVRALGLYGSDAGVKFSDVPASGWFAGAVGTAVKTGLVEGFEDNTFKPNSNITREQMAVMITRAMKIAGKTEIADLKLLDKFTDGSTIQAWAKDAVSQAAKAGIVNGVTDTTFVPVANATRAEAGVMLKRLLTFVQFLN